MTTNLGQQQETNQLLIYRSVQLSAQFEINLANCVYYYIKQASLGNNIYLIHEQWIYRRQFRYAAVTNNIISKITVTL